jgi:hypothetical protein
MAVDGHAANRVVTIEAEVRCSGSPTVTGEPPGAVTRYCGDDPVRGNAADSVVAVIHNKKAAGIVHGHCNRGKKSSSGGGPAVSGKFA